MFYTFSDFDRRNPWSDLFRQLDRSWRGSAPPAPTGDGVVSLVETPESLEFRIDVPGVAEADLKLDIHDAQTLTLSAKRSIPRREGFATHRTERSAFEWKKSFTLPAKVDASKTTANLENGVLSVLLAKLPESQPKRVQITAR
ncbi:MAG: Hsp20/alpha crystallin family protein [Myxococcota bacterium]